ncbi:hypothetical protein LTS10_012096 [Elasticomyces elasticus]|nr:hypothetical protein LTS10_012096 [Elasticomyces elasticus]
MGKPRTPGPASKKRKADDARYTEGEEGSNKTIPGTTAGRPFTKAELATIPTCPRAQRDAHDTQIPFGTAIRRSDTRMPEDAFLTPEDHAYAASEASLHRQPAIKQEANQDTVLHAVPLHSDDSGYGAPDSDAKVDVKSVSAAYATSADQLALSAGSSSLYKTPVQPVQADMKNETPAASATFPLVLFSAGSLLSGCLEVLQNVSTNNKFYADAVDDVLKHAGDSPERISSVLAALHQHLPLERLGPIEQALIGDGLQFQAQALLANIDSPLNLRQALLTIFEGVPKDFLCDVPDILAHVAGSSASSSLPTPSSSASAHMAAPSHYEDHVTPGKAAKRCKIEIASSPPIRTIQDTAATELTTAKPKRSRRKPGATQSHCDTNANATMVQPQTNVAGTGSNDDGPDGSLAPTFIPFTDTEKQSDRVLYTVDCPSLTSTNICGGNLQKACSSAFGKHNIASVKKLNPHVWTVIFKNDQTAARALNRSITLHNTQVIADRPSRRPAKVFTWQSDDTGPSSKAVTRQLRAVWADLYPDMVVRYRRTKATEESPGSCRFVLQLEYAPKLFSFFVPIRTKHGITTAWFRAVNYHAPCPLCDSKKHSPGALCQEGKLAKLTGET